VILLVIAGFVWRKRRKGVTQTKDFDHQGPAMMNGNGLLYEDLAHARPRPPMAPPSIEMLDMNHHPGLGNNCNGLIGNPKLDFSYFLNPPPIYEELPELDGGHSDRNNGPSEDEFAEDELSVIDVPISQCHGGVMDGVGLDPTNQSLGRYHAAINRNTKPRAQSLNRKRGATAPRNSTGGGFKSQRSLDRRARNANMNAGGNNPNKPPGTNPRQYNLRGMGNNNPGSGMLILSDHNGMTMKIPPHLVAVLAESALCNGGGRPYEVIPSGGLAHPANNMGMGGNNGTGQVNGIYPSSRSSGSSYGDGSASSGSARINPTGNSIESSSFDSGIGPHSITSFINSPAYDQTMYPPPGYPMNTYEYATTPGGTPAQFLTSQHPSFRRLRMTSDREHPLYSNHLLT
jgi:hypothetical protein